jgi:hypothetical protein
MILLSAARKEGPCMTTASVEFRRQELQSLRTELQERNRETNRLVMATIAGSFAIFGFGLGTDLTGESLPVRAACTLVPALVVPFVIHWMTSEFHSSRRIAFFIRMVSEPALAEPESTGAEAGPLGWERLMAKWDDFYARLKKCEKLKEQCKGCAVRREPEKTLWTQPKLLALNMVMVLSPVIAAALYLGRPEDRPEVFSWPMATPWAVLILAILANAILRFRYIYPASLKGEWLRGLSPNCREWSSFLKDVEER